MSDLVTLDIRDHVADVRLNRPEKMNAVNPELRSAILEAGESLLDAVDVRAVVLSGNGRAFSAGLDMESMAAIADAPADGKNRQQVRTTGDHPGSAFQRAALIWKRLPMPVIGAIHGVAYGAGAQLALGTDIRFVAPDVRFSILEIKWGLVPDVGITQTLRDVVPLDVAKELTWTGRVLDGAAARECGIATHVAEDPHAAAMALAAEIAARSPDAIRRGKTLLERSWYAQPNEMLAFETDLQAELIGSPNQKEAVKAGFEKRTPVFGSAK